MIESKVQTDCVPTEIGYLDRILGGGAPCPGTHAIFGPTGSGLTTLAAQLAAQAALRQRTELKRTGREGRVFFVTLGQSVSEIETLALSHLARIDRHSFLQAKSLADFSSATTLHDYEQKREADLQFHGDTLHCEQDRIAAMKPVLDDHFRVVDLGASSFKGCWTPVVKIAAKIEAVLGPEGIVGAVVIDDCSLAVERAVSLTGEDSIWALERMLREFPANCRDLISRRWGCPVWITHHLRGAVADLPATDFLHHRDAASCRQFAVNLNACIVLGSHQSGSGCFLVRCTKSPWPERSAEPVIAQIDPNFATVIERPDCMIDPKRRRIVTTEQVCHIDIDASAQQHLKKLVAKSADSEFFGESKRIRERSIMLDL